MKKIILALFMILMLLPSLCGAVEPTITSDKRTFNPLTGVYDLQGHVFVQFPAHDTMLTITGDTTKVHFYKMEVHGQDNITLSFGEMRFKCDKVDVYHKDRTAYVEGKCNFKDAGTVITADKGSYCWQTKLASFQGNVKVNGKAYQDEVVYNVMTKQLVDTKAASTENNKEQNKADLQENNN